MADGEGKGEGEGEGEDLFEDLDKFFAPIQDVDWPEPAEPPGSPRAEIRPGTPAPEPPEPQEEREEPGAAGDTPVTAPAPGREDLFTGEPGVGSGSQVGDRAEEEEEVGGGVGAFLFETEETGGSDGDEEAPPGEELPASAREGYVELPGPALEDEGAVAELIEEGPDLAPELEEEPPDLEAVEAAAEHFAESVREEVRIEPEPTGPSEPGQPTEEIKIAALLGEEEAVLEEAEPARTIRVGPEGLGGPSWQEPTAVEVGAEHERPGARNVPLAFLTGLVLGGLALGAIAIGAGPFALLAGAVVLVAQGELYLALQKRHYQPATALGLVAGALVLGAGYYRGEGAMLAIAALSVFATFLWYMTVPAPHRRNVVTNVALTVLGIFYIPLLASYALVVLKLPDGRGLALAIVGLTFAYDTAAFAVGYFWGSRPLAPNVSPKKSWEGAIGATLVVVAVAVGAVAPSVTILDTVGRSVGLAVVVAIFAPLGDLAESLLKRDLGIKDMGSILPGHGGVLDRIDSVLFVAPAAFVFLRLILL